MKIKPIELVRINESIWRENYKRKEMTDDEIIKAMVERPKLMERPIVITIRLREISIPPRSVADAACVSKLVSSILVVDL